MAGTTIEYDLKEVLAGINTKLDNLREDIAEIKLGQVKLETELTQIKSDVSELKDTQSKQLWYLMWTVIGAVITTVLKFGFFPNAHF